jgi:hypothetical protein
MPEMGARRGRSSPFLAPLLRLLGKLGFRFDRMVTMGAEELRLFVSEP